MDVVVKGADGHTACVHTTTYNNTLRYDIWLAVLSRPVVLIENIPASLFAYTFVKRSHNCIEIIPA